METEIVVVGIKYFTAIYSV